MSALPAGFTGPVPVFPLPTVVLFPQTIVPLHVFEPRYRAMVVDALAGDRLIAMALLKPGWEKDYEGAPPVHEVVGVGRILHDERTEDGRYNILLEGVARARIEELLPPAPYRRARVRVLPEPDGAAFPELDRVRLGLLAIYASLLAAAGPSATRREINPSLGTLCDMLTAMLDVEVGQKQAILEEVALPARAARTIELIRRSPHASLPIVSGLQKAVKRSWPPKPDSN